MATLGKFWSWVMLLSGALGACGRAAPPSSEVVLRQLEPAELPVRMCLTLDRQHWAQVQSGSRRLRLSIAHVLRVADYHPSFALYLLGAEQRHLIEVFSPHADVYTGDSGSPDPQYFLFDLRDHLGAVAVEQTNASLCFELELDGEIERQTMDGGKLSIAMQWQSS